MKQAEQLIEMAKDPSKFAVAMAAPEEGGGEEKKQEEEKAEPQEEEEEIELNIGLFGDEDEW